MDYLLHVSAKPALTYHSQTSTETETAHLKPHKLENNIKQECVYMYYIVIKKESSERHRVDVTSVERAEKRLYKC